MIKLKNVTKKYGDKIAADNVSITIKEGMSAFIGPNGAGKTTTMKIILGMIKQYDGEVQVEEVENKRKFGSLMENPKFYPTWTGLENLKYFATVFELKNDKSIDELIKYFEMEKFINKNVEEYSLGMKQKLGICIALLGYPKYLILDEPTNGLDPDVTKSVMEKLKLLQEKENIIILISSHMLATLSKYCDNVIMIREGKIINSSSLDDIVDNNVTNYSIKTNVTTYECDSNTLNDKLKEIISSGETISNIHTNNDALENLYFKEAK